MGIESRRRAFQAPSPEHRPRNWEEVEVPGTSVTCRLIYSVHMAAHPRQLEELGAASMVGIEGGPYIEEENADGSNTAYGDAALDPSTLEMQINRSWNGQPERWEENWKLYKATQEGLLNLHFFMTDPWVPMEVLDVDEDTETSLRDASTKVGISSLSLATLLLAGAGASHVLKADVPTRRGFLLGGGAALVAGAVSSVPRAHYEVVMRELTPFTESGGGWRAVDEESKERIAERLISPLLTAEHRLMGLKGISIGFRNLVIAEQLTRLAGVAEARGEKNISQVIGMAHFGIAAAIKLPQEVRTLAIEEYLVALQKDGHDTEMIRASMNHIPEISWSQEEEKWKVALVG